MASVGEDGTFFMMDERTRTVPFNGGVMEGGRVGKFVGEGKISSYFGTCVCAGEVRGIPVDVDHHVACHIFHGGVLVRANIMEQLGAGVGCVRGYLALLGSNCVEGHQYAAVDCTRVVQEYSYNLLCFSYSNSIHRSCGVNWVC